MVNYDFDLGLGFNFELKTPPGQPAGNEVLFKHFWGLTDNILYCGGLLDVNCIMIKARYV